MSDPTAAPTFVPGLPGSQREPVLVTGGTGTLGRAVVAELQRSHVPARVLTRHTDACPGTVTGDLRTGDGLDAALDGVVAVINCATDTHHGVEVDVDGTRRLTELAASDVRFVHMSILGCWNNPLPYYRAKSASETVVIDSGLPHAIVRATQFHPFLAHLLTPKAGVTTAPRGTRAAPIDPAFVARRLVDVTLGSDLPGRVVELAGPEILTARDAAILTAHTLGLHLRRHVSLPAIGGIARAFARGSNLPGPDAERGGCTYAEWLGDHRAQLTAD